MEFTFGLLLGGALGYAAWLSRRELTHENEYIETEQVTSYRTILKEFVVTLIVALLIFWFLSFLLGPVFAANRGYKGFSMVGLRDIAILLSSFAFFGLIIVIAVMRFPTTAWQLAITLTFCHTAIDLIRDFYPDVTANSPFTARFALIFLITLVVGILTAYFQRKNNMLYNMLLLLVWSTVAVSFLRMSINPENLSVSGLSLCKIVCGKFIVDIIFLVSACVVSWISIQKIKKLQS
jgi:hypothetical protein